MHDSDIVLASDAPFWNCMRSKWNAAASEAEADEEPTSILQLTKHSRTVVLLLFYDSSTTPPAKMYASFILSVTNGFAIEERRDWQLFREYGTEIALF
jgi:hypothetical protein